MVLYLARVPTLTIMIIHGDLESSFLVPLTTKLYRRFVYGGRGKLEVESALGFIYQPFYEFSLVG
jgi:hypothetical protein